MEDSFSRAEDVIKDVKSYFNNRIALLKIEIAENLSSIISNSIAIIISILMIMFFLFFLSCGLAIYLGKLTGELYIGFLIVSGLYLVTGLIIHKLKGRLIRMRIMNAILKQFFNEQD